MVSHTKPIIIGKIHKQEKYYETKKIIHAYFGTPLILLHLYKTNYIGNCQLFNLALQDHFSKLFCKIILNRMW